MANLVFFIVQSLSTILSIRCSSLVHLYLLLQFFLEVAGIHFLPVDNFHISCNQNIHLQLSMVLSFFIFLSPVHCQPLMYYLVCIKQAVELCSYSGMTFTTSFDPVTLNSIWSREPPFLHFLFVSFTSLNEMTIPAWF